MILECFNRKSTLVKCEHGHLYYLSLRHPRDSIEHVSGHTTQSSQFERVEESCEQVTLRCTPTSLYFH